MKGKKIIAGLSVSAMLAAILPMSVMAAAQTPEGIYADKTGIYLSFASDVTSADYENLTLLQNGANVTVSTTADEKVLKVTPEDGIAVDTTYRLEMGDFKKSFMVETVTDVDFDSEQTGAKASGTWAKTIFEGNKGSVAVGGAHYDIVDKDGDKKLYVSPMDPNNQYNARAYAAPTELFGKDDSYTVSFELTSYGYNALHDRYLINGTEVDNGVSVDNSLQLNMKGENYGVINRYGDTDYYVVAEGTYYNDYDAETDSSAAGPKYMGDMVHTDGTWMNLGDSACTYYNYDALYEKNKEKMDGAQTRNAVIRKNGSVITVEYDGVELYSFDYTNSGVTTKIAEEGLFTISVSRAHIKLLDDISVTKFTEVEDLADYTVENVYADLNGVRVRFNKAVGTLATENITLSLQDGTVVEAIVTADGKTALVKPVNGMTADTVYKVTFNGVSQLFKIEKVLDVDFDDKTVEAFAAGTVSKKDFAGEMGTVTAAAKRGDIIDENGNKKLYIASENSAYEEVLTAYATPNYTFETTDEYTVSFKMKSFGYDTFVERFMIGGEVRSDGKFEGADALWVELKPSIYQIRKYNKVSLLTDGVYVNESVKPERKSNIFEGTDWLNYYDGSTLNYTDLYNNVNGTNLNKTEIDSAVERNVSVTKTGNNIIIFHDGLELLTYDCTEYADLLDGAVGVAGSGAAGQILDDFVATKYVELEDIDNYAVENVYADLNGIRVQFDKDVNEFVAENIDLSLLSGDVVNYTSTVSADTAVLVPEGGIKADVVYCLEFGDVIKYFKIETVTDVDFDSEQTGAKATGTWAKTTFAGAKGSVAVGGAHYDIVDKDGDKKLYVSPMEPNNEYNARAYVAPTELFGKDASYTVSFELTSYGYNYNYDRYLINGTEVDSGVSVDNSLQLNMKATNYGVINRYGDVNYNVVAAGTYYNDYDAETNSSAAGPKYADMFHTNGDWMNLGDNSCTYYNYDALYEKNKTEMDKAQTRNAVIRKNGSVITVEYDGVELYSFDYENSGVTTKIAEEGLFTISVSRAHIKLLDDIVVTRYIESSDANWENTLVLNNDYSVSCGILGGSKDSEAELIRAVYDGKGALVDADIKPVTVKANTMNSFTMDSYSEELPDEAEIKCFIWDMEQKPLLEAVSKKKSHAVSRIIDENGEYLSSESGELTLAFIGGSITAGDSDYNGTMLEDESKWTTQIVNYYREEFPQKTVTAYNAGLGGTQSDYGAQRFEKHVLSKEPDIIFMEYTLNDCAVNAENEWYNQVYVEEMLRACKNAEKEPVVVYLHLPEPLDSGTTAYSNYQKCIGWKEEVTDAYGVKAIDLNAYLWENYNQAKAEDSTLEFMSYISKYYNGDAENGYDVHPKTEGHKLMADSIIDAIEKDMTGTYKQMENAEKIWANDTVRYNYIAANDYDRITYSEGDFTLYTAENPYENTDGNNDIIPERHYSYPSFPEGIIQAKNAESAEFSFKSSANSFSLAYISSLKGLSAKVYVDGVFKKEISCDSEYYGMNYIVSSSIASDGETHTVKVVIDDSTEENYLFRFGAIIEKFN